MYYYSIDKIMLQKYRLSAIVSVITITLLGSASSAWASPIDQGFDLFQTVDGTFVDLGGGIGLVNLQGVPIGPGNTDTIVKRIQGSGTPFDQGDNVQVDIELVALSLTGNIPGFTVDVISGTLMGEPANPTGTMTIFHSNSDGDPTQGTFLAVLPVDIKVILTDPNGNTNTITGIPTKIFTTNPPGIWQHVKPPNYPDDPNFPAGMFFPTGIIQEETADGSAKHIVRPAAVPTVGGELLPIDNTALLLAGAQTFSWMIPVLVAGIGIGLFVVSRKSE